MSGLRFLPVVSAAMLLAGTATADDAVLQKPLWEIGLFNVVASLPDYRGSDESTLYAFPLPYLIYRGTNLRATREGVRGIFFQNDWIETSLSVSGNPPVNRNNRARAGMPELDAIGELGPAVKWFFMGRDPVDKLYLELSARAVASVSFAHGPQVRYQGIAGNLGTVFYSQSRVHDLGIRYHLSAGAYFGDAGYHRYFYQVDPAYATADRPAYTPQAGFGGTYASASMQYEITPTLAIGFYSRWDNLSGASFVGSPLVKQENNVVIGAALILKPWHSATMVTAEDFD